ncbi:MAG: hypothetical protein ACRC5H_06775 [Treponemataceae bacterium]
MITSLILQTLLKSFAFLFLLLLIARLAYNKISFFKKFFLPPAVIAGFLGLSCSPNLWAIKNEMILNSYATWAVIPSVFIILIFVAAQLGVTFKNRNAKKLPTVLMWGGLFSACGSAQMVAGFGVSLFFMHFFPQIPLYKNFGYELSQGFAGGHGMAGAIASFYQRINISHWQEAQGITAFFATIGLFFGMIFGIIFINRHYKKTMHLKIEKPIQHEEIPSKNEKEENSFSFSTVGIIFIICLASFILMDLFQKKKVPFFSTVPVWFYGIIFAQIVNFFLNFFKIQYCISDTTKKNFVSFFSDIIIVAALATMPIKTIAQYFLPIMVMAFVGFLVTFVISFPLMKFFFSKDKFSFERSILNWGVNTGVLVNGLTLLKICDPQLKSTVLSDFTLAFSCMIFTSFIITPLSYHFLATQSTVNNFIFAFISVVFYIGIAIIGKFLQKSHTSFLDS